MNTISSNVLAFNCRQIECRKYQNERAMKTERNTSMAQRISMPVFIPLLETQLVNWFWSRTVNQLARHLADHSSFRSPKLLSFLYFLSFNAMTSEEAKANATDRTKYLFKSIAEKICAFRRLTLPIPASWSTNVQTLSILGKRKRNGKITSHAIIKALLPIQWLKVFFLGHCEDEIASEPTDCA